MTYRIPFNKPFIVGRELEYIARAVAGGHVSGGGEFTGKCQAELEAMTGAKRVLLTTSGTAALELAAILSGVGPGDEVILPSFTFVSTANAFYLRGAKPVFVDVRPDTLNLDEELAAAAVTDRTRVIVPVHYGGVGAALGPLAELARARGLLLVEDAAQALGAAWRDRPLGTIGQLGAFSFHETKNFSCGEGGALAVNDERFLERAEIVREKGTDRSRFFRGEVDRYTWRDLGSSYLPSDILAAFLFAQLENADKITRRRLEIYDRYREELAPLEEAGKARRPVVPAECRHGGHLFYLLLNSREERDGLIARLKERSILAVFHYQPLHLSPVGRALGGRAGQLPVTESVSERLVRLPLYYDLTPAEQGEVIAAVLSYF